MRLREISPAVSSTLMCLDIAGWLRSKGSISSFTDASPKAKRARMARRVGSESAEKAWLKRSKDIASPYGYIARWRYIDWISCCQLQMGDAGGRNALVRHR